MQYTIYNLQFKKNLKVREGFTLIELLVVISIIAILLGVTLIGLQGSRESSRDAKRKSDLELVRSGLELYKADCKRYPVGAGYFYDSGLVPFSAGVLTGDDSTSACATSNTYITQVPKDPVNPARRYLYNSDGITYQMCSALEQLCTSNCSQGVSASAPQTCGSSNVCGSETCNYKVINP